MPGQAVGRHKQSPLHLDAASASCTKRLTIWTRRGPLCHTKAPQRGPSGFRGRTSPAGQQGGALGPHHRASGIHCPVIPGMPRGGIQGHSGLFLRSITLSV
ncbi:unnamed protein product [Arctogadus glacialis]